MARAVQARTHSAARRVQHSVEEQPLDPLMVVEVLHVPQVRHRHPDVRMQVGRAVPGDLQVACRRQGRAADELGDAAAPGLASSFKPRVQAGKLLVPRCRR